MTSMELLEIEQVVVGSDVHPQMSTSPETAPVTLFDVKSELVMAEYNVKLEPLVPGYDVMSEPVTPEYNVTTDPETPEYKVNPDPVMPGYDVKLEPVHQTNPHSLQCFQCFIIFSNHKAWERHMKKNHKLEYELLHQEPLTPEYNDMTDPKTPKDNVMSEPVKPVHKVTSNSMTPAQQTYSQDSLQCFQCFITFSCAKAKVRHMKKSHREEYKLFLQKTDTVFTCYACDKTFSTSDKLSKHSASHRAEDKPFRCNYCHATFQTFAEVMPHRRLECTKRQYVCQDCNMGFRSIIGRRKHRATVHLQEGKDYRCCKCNKSFLTKKGLLQHQENDKACCVPRQKRGRPPKKSFAGDETHHLTPPHRKRGRPTKIDMAGEKHIIPPHKKKRGRPTTNKTKEPKEAAGLGANRERQCELPSEEQQKQEELEIPCPEDDCDDVFPSVAALRDHRKERHGPPPHPHKAPLCMDQQL